MSIFAADMKKSIRIAGVGLVMAVVCGGVYLNGLMPIITGYAAKNLASAVFVSGREAKDVEELDLDFSLIRNGKYLSVPRDMYWCDGHDGQMILIIPLKTARGGHPELLAETRPRDRVRHAAEGHYTLW